MVVVPWVPSTTASYRDQEGAAPVGVTAPQIRRAEQKQHAAARDPRPQVRLVAGPGTGKSFAIEERVRWLLQSRVPPASIYVVSFTRAAALDLCRRVRDYCTKKGQAGCDLVSVSTLHSLALRILRAGGLLSAYLPQPRVMDTWELKNIFDAEFAVASGYRPGGGAGYSPGRCEEIRRQYEAFLSTRQWTPPNYIHAHPPVSPQERQAFITFHGPRTLVYSCVLPGEIVRKCVENIDSGLLDPRRLLGMQHLIVDEYQDLNPCDLDFVDRLADMGAVLFVAGDDDQSIYSFRYGSPAGIQRFLQRYPTASDHHLTDCFRCCSAVVQAANALMVAHPCPGRIPERLVSLYDNSSPPVPGVVHHWAFSTDAAEAHAIASSCRALINAGIRPQDILILISNKRALLTGITRALTAAQIEYEARRDAGFADSPSGRFVLGLLRLACDGDDYVAHRLVLGQLPHVGPSTCNSIAESVTRHNLNLHDLLHQQLPDGVFDGRELAALKRARSICQQIASWQSPDTLDGRGDTITNIIRKEFGGQAARMWDELRTYLPGGMTLEEARDYLWADTDEQQAALLEGVYLQLGLKVPAGGLLPHRVRIMTMHGAKGLGAHVVFVPGLEEGLLPARKAMRYSGLVLEQARLLYMSITRARAACILSYAERRWLYGRSTRTGPSRFAANLGGRFRLRRHGLTSHEVVDVVSTCAQL